MKWVIDDQDDGDIPGLSSSHSQGSCPVTSQIAVEDLKPEENTEVKACPTARERISLPETTKGKVQPRRMRRRSKKDLSQLTEGEVSALKYNRMRQLNNESSRRCRQNKKLRQELLQKELQDQTVQHVLLKERCEALETKVRNMKRFILKHFKDPQKEIEMARKRIIFGDKINDDILGRIVVTKDLPDISSIWSNLY